MKTTISIPDETFQDAERCAEAVGMSQSEFFTVAARHYIEKLDAQSLTSRIDAAIDLFGEDESSGAAVGAGRHVLAAGTDEW
jgi:metal-responsive CopG/Arc/MetJ family transcriptional regulator